MPSPFITRVIISSSLLSSSSSSSLLIRPITRNTTRLWSSYTSYTRTPTTTTTSLITQRRFSSSPSFSSSSSPPQNPYPDPNPTSSPTPTSPTPTPTPTSPTPTHTPLIIGIRREDARRTWERRAPLTPDDVRRILGDGEKGYRRFLGRGERGEQGGGGGGGGGEQGGGGEREREPDRDREREPDRELDHAPTLLPFPIQIHIQPSRKRIFKDREYREAGAVVREDLSDAHVVVGIKEVGLGEGVREGEGGGVREEGEGEGEGVREEGVMREGVGMPGVEVGVGVGVGVGAREGEGEGEGVNRKVERTYMMFSHTAKGQEYNMPLLDMFLGEVYDSSSSLSSSSPSSHLPTLIDYELLTDKQSNKRSLAFGYHAGIAGTLLTLHTLGEYFLREDGVRTPWVWVPLTYLGGGGGGGRGELEFGRGGGGGGGLGSTSVDLDLLPIPYSYPLPDAPDTESSLPSEEEVRRTMRGVVGRLIRGCGTDGGKGGGNENEGGNENGGGNGKAKGRYGPCVIGVTGSGNVSQGVLSLLRELPHEFMSVDEVVENFKVEENEGGLGLGLDRVYIVHIKPEDYIVRTDSEEAKMNLDLDLDSGLRGTKFTPTYDRTLYHASPSLFTSVLGKRIGRYLTVLVNGAGWGEGYPRVMTCRDLEGLREGREEGRGRLVVVGDISCDLYGGLEFVTHATTLNKPFYKLETNRERPVYIQSVDILPASLPLDASVHFSNGLRRYLWGVVRRYGGYVRDPREEGERDGKGEREEREEREKGEKGEREERDGKGEREEGEREEGEREEGERKEREREVDEALDRATIAYRGNLAPRFTDGGLVRKVREYRMRVGNGNGRGKREYGSLASSNSNSSLGLGLDSTSSKSTITTENQNQNQNQDQNQNQNESHDEINQINESRTKKPKKILILGTGMVAAPAVRWIVRRRMYGNGNETDTDTDTDEDKTGGGLEIIVAGKERGELEGLEGVVRGIGGGVVFKQIQIDFGENKGKGKGKGGELEELVRDVDVVIR
ncbi:hypothetical protein F5890DRAFT_1559840 [Lentinula detonsa]|uniref:Alanine dehydrogenase/pyridine nucleotide transhydrogenase N-terminal domain-containing protein n=1 Tax=Lentinula detonsa TaxID=2804962 RepID=A0AA38ULY9_9AGAR|nr:hypothetical protein F5890DRAFT_1559840 [Lentinula detonsa]